MQELKKKQLATAHRTSNPTPASPRRGYSLIDTVAGRVYDRVQQIRYTVPGRAKDRVDLYAVHSRA